MAGTLEITRTAILGGVPDAPVAGPAPEVLAGYTLKDRLGVGGYGEVWSAIGPGGLCKAVKILHGRFDGPQADTELKALHSMRELRHPFLLSLERAEVVNGRLIIVTELADSSLEERFQVVRGQGMNGLPRDELLAYLRDAADALDFMSERHGLQHLDVKPENLFLQGNHLKVGDFGLTKEIRRTNVSLINGFTALYAAPEIFEGRPSKSSDQYSLAIVYQAMLTGTPPFSGRTPAQLTAQHLTGTPDLSALSPTDRPAVSRALSKNPQARFPSCRQFVEELASRKPSSRSTTARSQSAGTSATPPGTIGSSPSSLKGDSTQHVAPLPELQTTPLPPVSVHPSETKSRPAIIVAMGGLGARILNEVRVDLANRFGTATDCPAFQFLAIDTDPRAISAAGSNGGRATGVAIETLAIPLRDPKEYRSDSEGLLEWLSRRWLFNIPRSQQVEGIRPLGRLALVDHHQEIRSRIRDTIRRAMSEEARETTAAATGQTLETAALDVFLVASISGGTGAGAILDLGYLVRDVSRELGGATGEIHGILLHGTGMTDGAKDVQKANAIACLAELKRFMTPELGFPGDRACNLPAEVTGPFDHTYVISLGEGLSDADYEREMASVAEYVSANIATPAGGSFREWRRLERVRIQSSGEQPGVRSYAMAKVKTSFSPELRGEAVQLSRAAVGRWLIDLRMAPNGAMAKSPAVKGEVESLLSRLQIAAPQLASKLNALLGGETNRRLEGYFQTQWPRLAERFAEGRVTVESAFQNLDAELSTSGVMPDISWAVPPEKAATEIRRWIMTLADTSEGRLATAAEAVGDILHRLHEIIAEWTRMQSEIEHERSRIVRDAMKAVTPGSRNGAVAMLHVPCLQYGLLNFCLRVHRSFVEYAESLRRSVSAVGTELAALCRGLDALDAALAKLTSTSDSVRERTIPAATVSRFDETLRGGRAFSLSGLPLNEMDAPTTADRLIKAALEFLSQRNGPGDPGSPVAGQGAAETPISVHTLTERLSQLGGGRRILALVPQVAVTQGLKATLTASFGDCVSIQPEERGEPTVCCEVEGVAVDRMIAKLAHGKPVLIEMASRLHTRIDVEW